MKLLAISAALIPASVLLAANVTFAAECAISKSPKELSLTEVGEHYKCARDKLVKGYQAGDNANAKAYTSWKPAATGPGKPGFHSNRYLMTYVNDIGYDTYVAYKPSGVNFPIGSIVAKESYKIKKGGKLKPGPLFFMTKVGVEEAPKTDGWLYSGVKGNGKKFKVSQKFCHGCHVAYKAQDAMGYPLPELRIK